MNMTRALNLSALLLCGASMLMASHMALAGEDDVYYSGYQAESPLSLYGFIDLKVAKDYLAPQGLEPVEISPGLALTGLTVIHYQDIDYSGRVLRDYYTNAFPFLVNRIPQANEPGETLVGVYYFSNYTSDSGEFRAITEATTGVNVQPALFQFSQPWTFPRAVNTASVYLPNCPVEYGCGGYGLYTSLRMGASNWAELQIQSGTVFDSQVLFEKSSLGQMAYHALLSGNSYGRYFDPARDSYWVAPGSEQGSVFEKGHFTPYLWSTNKRVDTKAVNLRDISH